MSRIEEPSVSLAATSHWAQLDGLRAIAIILVLISHYTPNTVWAVWLPSGHEGVRLFFVLSGFLITGILLDAKSRIEDDRITSGKALGVFYARRALRILPLFYGVLIIGAIIGISSIRESFLWQVFYLSNFYLIKIGEFQNPISVYWSLAVEEQFYLVWPFLIIFVSRRFLPLALVVAILLGPLSRILFQPSFGAMTNLIPVTCLDSLGAGGLLAWWLSHSGRSQKGFILLGIIAFPAYIVTRFLEDLDAPNHLDFLVQTFRASFYTWLIWYAVLGPKNFWGKFLELRWMQYIGRISYGLYVLHMIPTLFTFRIPGIESQPVLRVLVLLVLTFAMAMISWHFYEAPINSLKSRFTYNKPANVSET